MLGNISNSVKFDGIVYKTKRNFILRIKKDGIKKVSQCDGTNYYFNTNKKQYGYNSSHTSNQGIVIDFYKHKDLYDRFDCNGDVMAM